MSKRGQVILFIIVGIALLVMFGAFFLLSSILTTKDLQSASSGPLPIEVINTQFEDCLYKTADEGVIFLGMQGGYYSLPPVYRISDPYFIPYYFYQGLAQFPSREVLEKQLALFIQDAMPKCIDFTSLEQQGFSIKVSYDLENDLGQKEVPIYNSDSVTPLFQPEVSATIPLAKELIKASILDDIIILDANYKVIIKKGNAIRELTHFTRRFPTDLGKIHALAGRIIQYQSENYPRLPLGLVSEEVLEQEAYFSTVAIGEDLLYSLYLHLPEESPNLKSLQFNFLIGYNWSTPLAQLSGEVSRTPAPPNDDQENYNPENQYSVPSFSVLPAFITSVAAQEAGADPADSPPSAVPALSENWDNPEYVQFLSNENLLASVSENPALMDNSIVLGEFELRLGGNSFVENVNSDRSLLNEWAKRKGISFGDKGQLAEYQQGKIVTKGESSSTFSPQDVPGALVLESGAVQLPNGAIILNANIEQRYAKLVVHGGTIDLRESSSVHTIVVEKSHILAGGYSILPSSDSLSVSVNEEQETRLSGEATLSGEGIPAFFFTGELTVDDAGFRIGSGSKFTEMADGDPSVEYMNRGTKPSRYVLNTEKCDAKEGCIQRDFDKGEIIITAPEAVLSIRAYDALLGSVQVRQLSKEGEVIIIDTTGVTLYFSQGPVEISGNPSQLSLEVESTYTFRGQPRVLRLVPGEQGTRVLDCSRRECQNMGILTDRSLLFMGAMRSSRSKEAGDSRELATRYGSPGQKIRGYLDEPRELRVVNAFFNAANRNRIDPYFLMATAFGEGLADPEGFFARYYKNPNAKVNSFLDLGADRFKKEAGILKEKGYLREDFEEYAIVGKGESERSEVITFVEFENIEAATEGLAAMVRQRQDFLERDLLANGINPNDLTPDELHYWTYVYYNAGSGPPEDPKGIGRSIVVNRALRGRENLRNPTRPQPEFLGEMASVNPLANAQRIIATTALLREPSDASLPLSAQRVAVSEAPVSKPGGGS